MEHLIKLVEAIKVCAPNKAEADRIIDKFITEKYWTEVIEIASNNLSSGFILSLTLTKAINKYDAILEENNYYGLKDEFLRVKPTVKKELSRLLNV